MRVCAGSPDWVDHYFGYFSPTLGSESIVSVGLRGSPRQLVDFLDLFPKFDDINFRSCVFTTQLGLTYPMKPRLRRSEGQREANLHSAGLLIVGRCFDRKDAIHFDGLG